jgi:hypothetical protein
MPVPSIGNSTHSSWMLSSHVVPSPVSLAAQPQLTVVPPEHAAGASASNMQATAAAIHQLRQLAFVTDNLDAALHDACHNSGVKGAIVSLSWTLKGLATASLIQAFAKAFKTDESDDNFAQKDILTHLLAGLIAGGLVLGLVHAFLDKRAGAWLNRCGAATITLPSNGKALTTFNFWFSSVFAFRSALIAGLVEANKMNFFDTDDEKSRVANALVVSLISSVLSIVCGYIGTRIGSALAVAATPIAHRRAMLTVKEDAPNGPYVENNGTFHPRAGTNLIGGANEGERFREIMLSRALAGGFSGVSQEFFSMLLRLLPFVTDNGSLGQVIGTSITTAYAVQQAVNGGWRVAAQETLKGVVRSQSHHVGDTDTHANTRLQKLLLLPSSENSMESFACHIASSIYALQRASARSISALQGATGCMGSAAVAPRPPANLPANPLSAGTSSARSHISGASVAGTLHPPRPSSQGSSLSQRQISQESSDRSPPQVPREGSRISGREWASSAGASNTGAPSASPPLALNLPSSLSEDDRASLQMMSSGVPSELSAEMNFTRLPVLEEGHERPSMQTIEDSMRVLQNVLDMLIEEDAFTDQTENTPLLHGNPDDARIIDELLSKLQRELSKDVQNQTLNDTNERERFRGEANRFIDQLRQLWAQKKWGPDALRDALSSENFDV